MDTFHLTDCIQCLAELWRVSFQSAGLDRDHVVHLGLNINSSTHNCGCMVNGSNFMAAI